MARRVGLIEGWPLPCPVCEAVVRFKGDHGCRNNVACTTHWCAVALQQRIDRLTAPPEPVDPAYEDGVWPPAARRVPPDSGTD